MYALRRLEIALKVIDSYQGEQPLHQYLRSWYRKHPEMGSRDRKLCSELTYSYFRTGKAFLNLSGNQKIAISLYLVFNKPQDYLEEIISECTPVDPATLVLPIKDKLKIIEAYFPHDTHDFFPFSNLSSGIDMYECALNMLTQPFAWIRVEPDKLSSVIQLLDNNTISYYSEGNAIGFKNGINLEMLGLNKKWYTIQDRNSQMTGNYFLSQPNEKWYDCCAASGGKSLLLHSLNPTVKLTVSDNRSSIIENLKERFDEKKLLNYRSFIIDLEDGNILLQDEEFDGIIADVPCTGSGTWARTPEQVVFFNSDDIMHYAQRQRKILRSVSALLRHGKPLIYITCSVFREENEDIVAFLCDELDFICEEMKVLSGNHHFSDTMFVARMIKK